MCTTIKSWFQNLDEVQLQVYVLRAIKVCDDFKQFKHAMRDLILATDQSSYASDTFQQELSELVKLLGPDWVDNRKF